MDRYVVDASVILKWVIGKDQEPDQSQASGLLKAWGEGSSEVPITEGIWKRCFDWMKKNKVTFYDTAYLSAAIEVKGRLITADEKFLRKMDRMEAICLIKHLDLR